MNEHSEEKNLLERLIAMGEERLESFVQELLTNPRVIQVMSRVIQRTQETRNLLEERLRQVYQLANIPTQADLKRLEEKLASLESRVSELTRAPRATQRKARPKKKSPSRRKKK